MVRPKYYQHIFAVLAVIEFYGLNCHGWETVLEDWIFDELELKDYETCRRALSASIPWPVTMKDDPNFGTVYGMNDVISFRQSADPDAPRSSVIHNYKTWENGVIPYTIPYGLSVQEKKLLACAFLFFHQKSCVKFVPRKYSDVDYIAIQRYSQGCYSEDLGRKGGRHVVNLHYPYCWSQGVIVHELMHAIGFFHEQSRNDRNKYIEIHWENIPYGWKQQFLSGTEQGLHQKLVGDYDYGSIMHYSRSSYAWGYKNVMTAKKGNIEENNKLMGNRAKPSKMDISKINELYSCHADKTDKKQGSKETTMKNGEAAGKPFGNSVLLGLLLVALLTLCCLAALILKSKRTLMSNSDWDTKYFIPVFLRHSKQNIPHSKSAANVDEKLKSPIFVGNIGDTVSSGTVISSAIRGSAETLRPPRPEQDILQNLYRERGEEMRKQRRSILIRLFGAPAASGSPLVPQRKAPPPPVANGPRLKGLVSKFSDDSKNVNRYQSSRVKALKQKFEKL